MLKIEEFVRVNKISEEGKREMLEIFNESLIEISKEILGREKKEKEKEKVKEKEKEVKKKYKSKKAEEYAEEHGISLEDFEMNEVSKKDVENKVREITNKNKIIKKVEKGEKGEKVEKVEKGEKGEKGEKVICSGINKKGECCKSTGTIQPKGAKKRYCFRHAEDYRSFECDSDSSNEEELDEELNEELKEEKIISENEEEEKIISENEEE